jgi:hypothetical protein
MGIGIIMIFHTHNLAAMYELAPGGGRILVCSHGVASVLKELSSTYPLKLLSARGSGRVTIVFLLSYGGGLVGGDQIKLSTEVQQSSFLLLLSQVFTFSYSLENFDCEYLKGVDEGLQESCSAKVSGPGQECK